MLSVSNIISNFQPAFFLGVAGQGSRKESIGQSGTQPDFSMEIQPNQFLMRNDTAASPGLVFTPLDGFTGTVVLHAAAVSPATSSAPTVSFSTVEVYLNSSATGSPSYSISVNASRATESGLYTLVVTGSSGSISHSAVATVGVTDAFISTNGAELFYKAHFDGVAYAGSSTDLNSSFSDLGYVSIGVKNLTAILDFGTYRYNACCNPFPEVQVWLDPYQAKWVSLNIYVPMGVKPGNYTVTAIISWVLRPGYTDQQSAPDLVTHGYLMVYPPPNPQYWDSPSPGIVFPILGGLALIVVVGLVLGYRVRRRATRTTPLSTTTCTNCGASFPVGTRFCARCGLPRD